MKTNCLFWAVSMWVRRGFIGYVQMRKSMWGPFPHFLYEEKRNGKLRQISYVPVNPKHKKLPPPFFNGKVRWGDPFNAAYKRNTCRIRKNRFVK